MNKITLEEYSKVTKERDSFQFKRIFGDSMEITKENLEIAKNNRIYLNLLLSEESREELIKRNKLHKDNIDNIIKTMNDSYNRLEQDKLYELLLKDKL